MEYNGINGNCKGGWSCSKLNNASEASYKHAITQFTELILVEMPNNPLRAFRHALTEETSINWSYCLKCRLLMFQILLRLATETRVA